jgi:hypothetical protein
MPAEITGVWCNACGEPLPDARPDDPGEGRPPCSACGSFGRLVKVFAHDEVTIHSDLGVKKKKLGFKSGGRSRPAQEQWSGDQQSADGVWRDRQRVVDRENNRYIERVTDPDGTVIRDVDEPLDQHLRHGSDKPKNGGRLTG